MHVKLLNKHDLRIIIPCARVYFVVIVNCNYSKQCRRPHATSTGNPGESIVIPARQLKDALFSNCFILQTLHITSLIQTNKSNYIRAAIFNNG